MKSQNLFTFGYEGLDIDAFVEKLHKSGVTSIFDVRELPLSRKKGFSKTAFSSRLTDEGIAYFHMPELGCPKAIREAYKQDSDWARYTRSFMTYLASRRDTLSELAKLAQATSACLVCFEADYTMCHRTYVAREAHKLGAPSVAHLTKTRTIADSPVRLVA